MEEWQKQHIQKNQVQLIRDTTCNAHLTSKLREAGILANVDVQSLELLHLTPFEKCKKLYELLLTRVGAYDILLNALEETNQSGALHILKQNNAIFRDAGKVTYDRNRVLGAGVYTKVYKGSFDGRDVAVKVLNTDFLDLDVSKREVDFLRKLDNHKNIIRYFTVEVSNNYVFIALELCHINLEDEMKMHLVKMDPTSILKQCTKGLAHLHRHNVIHRDLKPANILLTLDHQVKISDFGLSKQIPIGANSVSINGVVGTIDWMAPEILKMLQQQNDGSEHLRMTTSSDVFSLGCIFYFVLTNGYHPFGDLLQRQLYIVQNNPQLTHRGGVNDLWLQLITEMISHDAEARPSAKKILSSDCFHAQSAKSQQQTTVVKLPMVTRENSKVGVNENVSDSPLSERQMLKQQKKIPHYDISGDQLPHAVEKKEEEVLAKNQQQVSTPKLSETPNKNTVSKGDLENDKMKTLSNDIVSSTSEREILKESKKIPLNAELGLKLLAATRNNEPLSIIKKLIDQGADYRIKDQMGRGLLHYAAQRGNMTLLQFFLTLDLSLEDKDKSYVGQTPLFVAASTGHINVTEYLIRKGSSINVTDVYSGNVVHCAARQMSKEDFHELVCLLLDSYRANHLFKMSDCEGITPLHRRFQNSNTIKIATIQLIAAIPNIDMNTKSIYGENMLYSAIGQDYDADTIETLVKLRVNYKAKYGTSKRNFLHLAVEKGNEKTVKFLLSLDIDVNQADERGRTPMDIAKRNKHEKLITMLLDSGACSLRS